MVMESVMRPNSFTGILTSALVLLLVTSGCPLPPDVHDGRTRHFWFGMSKDQVLSQLPEAEDLLPEAFDDGGWASPALLTNARIDLSAIGPTLVGVKDVSIEVLILDWRLVNLTLFAHRRSRDRDDVFREVGELGRRFDALGWRQHGAVMLDTLLRPEWFAVEEHCRSKVSPDNEVRWDLPDGSAWFEVTVACERVGRRQELRWSLSYNARPMPPRP